jgi:hypothetical protein
MSFNLYGGFKKEKSNVDDGFQFSQNWIREKCKGAS